MKIIQSPKMQVHVCEFDEYAPSARLKRFTNRIDRMLGGDPEPPRPVRTIRFAGKADWSTGVMQLDDGESIVMGEKFKEPIIDNLTGNKLFGIIPVIHEGDLVEFHVDFVEEVKPVEPIL